MKNNYVLIDYENVQPKNLEILKGHEFIVKVFVGSKQTKVPIELATALQSFGDKAEYIQIEGNGPNALDFHIAYYMGKIANKDPDAYFHVISKDKGFDPLIAHMKKQGVLAMRENGFTEIPCIQIVRSSTAERAREYIQYLKARGEQPKPAKTTTLKNSIKNYFRNLLHDDDVVEVYEELVKRKIAKVDGAKVSYKLPS